MFGIRHAVDNEILDLSEVPDTVTEAAIRRVEQFQKWFLTIFHAWYADVIDASITGTRKCLTEKFPDDSPGNLDKESD